MSPGSATAPETAGQAPNRSPREKPGPHGPGSKTKACRSASDRDAQTGTHQANAVEVGLFPGAFLGALARMVPFVLEFDFLEFLERLRQQALGLFELDAEFIGRAGQVFPALD